MVFQADPDQLEQMLINLVRNAADAVLETRPPLTQGTQPCRPAPRMQGEFP